VAYHHPHCYLNTGDFDGNGTLDLCDGRLDPDCTGPGMTGGCCGPCWNSTGPDDPGSGDLLPPGWFSSHVDGTCGGLVGWPNVDWGDGNSCNELTGPWNFYFELIVPPDLLVNQEAGEFSVVMHSFADGEVGAWAGGPSVCSGDYPVRYDAPVDVGCMDEEGVATVAGKLYADYDHDCTYNGNEPGLGYHVITIRPSGSGTDRLVLTDRHGNYATTIDTGSYWIIPMLNGLEIEQCPDSIFVEATELCALNRVDIAVDDSLLCAENLDIHLVSGFLRICETSVMTVQVFNTGALEFIEPMILVDLDSLLELEMASVPYDDLGNNKYLLHLADIPPGLFQFARLNVKTDCNAPFGFLHCTTASLTAPLCTMDTVEDTDCFPNGTAIDPNFKIDSKDFSFGVTEIFDNSPIEYQIHFQNTGTSYANRITILDTLSSMLDPASFVFKGSSHQVEIKLLENHILQFFFDQINLPDSIADEPGSHGVVVFEIRPVEHLVVGDSVLNQSAIYFDFNPPVITNRKRHEVSCSYEITADSISIVPDDGSNSGAIAITFPDTLELSFLWSTGATTPELLNVSAGVYTVTVTNTSGCVRILELEIPFLTYVIDPEPFFAHLRPNPAGSTLYVEGLGSSDGMVVDVFSLTGKVLLSERFFGQGPNRLDVRELPSALYLCRVQTPRGMQVIKFVKR
jgi:hypothetical protein